MLGVEGREVAAVGTIDVGVLDDSLAVVATYTRFHGAQT